MCINNRKKQQGVVWQIYRDHVELIYKHKKKEINADMLEKITYNSKFTFLDFIAMFGKDVRSSMFRKNALFFYTKKQKDMACLTLTYVEYKLLCSKFEYVIDLV